MANKTDCFYSFLNKQKAKSGALYFVIMCVVRSKSLVMSLKKKKKKKNLSLKSNKPRDP